MRCPLGGVREKDEAERAVMVSNFNIYYILLVMQT